MFRHKHATKNIVISNIKFPLNVALWFVVPGYLIILSGYGYWSDNFWLAFPLLLLATVFFLLSLLSLFKIFRIAEQNEKSRLKKMLAVNVVAFGSLLLYTIQHTRMYDSSRYFNISFIAVLVAVVINLTVNTKVVNSNNADETQGKPKLFSARKIAIRILQSLGVLVILFIALSLAITNIGRYPTDKVVKFIDASGGEIVGKTGLRLTIPEKTFEWSTRVTLSLKQHNFILERFLPRTHLKLLALLSIKAGARTGLLGQIVLPAHANLIATYEVPLNLTIPVAKGYSGPVLLGEISSWGRYIEAIDIGIAKNGFAYFESPTLRDDQTVTTYSNDFVVLTLPADFSVFKRETGWNVATGIAKIPNESIIAVTSRKGTVAIPVLSRESMVYFYNYGFRNEDFWYYYRPDLNAEWVATTDQQLIGKFFKPSEIERMPHND